MEISLALGGGGVKGFAHIGVLDCLVKEGFIIQAVAGTSIGGLIGAIFAAGYQPREIQNIVEGLNQSRLYSRNPKDNPSLLGYTGISETLIELLGNNHFADLKIPFACTAVDLLTSQEVYLNDGLVVDALLASMAIPGIFPTKKRGEAELVDGAVLDPVPVNLARRLLPAKPVIAVVLNPAREQWHQLPQYHIAPPVSLPIPSSIVDGLSRMRIAQAFLVFAKSLDITARMMAELRLEIDRPEIIIRPDVYKYGLLDQANPSEIIQAGYLATQKAIPEIRKVMSWSNRLLRILRRHVPKNGSAHLQNEKETTLPKSIPGASK